MMSQEVFAGVGDSPLSKVELGPRTQKPYPHKYTFMNVNFQSIIFILLNDGKLFRSRMTQSNIACHVQHFLVC